MKNTLDDEIAVALQGIRTRLDTLASINAEHMLIPGGPQERSHQMVEEAYAALGLLVSSMPVTLSAKAVGRLLGISENAEWEVMNHGICLGE